MRRSVSLFCTTLLLFSAPIIASAQCITFSSHLSAYTDVSTDGTNVYSSVAMDGTEEMDIAQSCAPYLPSIITTQRYTTI